MAHILSVHILHCGDETQIVEAFAEHDFVRGSSERIVQRCTESIGCHKLCSQPPEWPHLYKSESKISLRGFGITTWDTSIPSAFSV